MLKKPIPFRCNKDSIMAKNIWIRASVTGCQLASGRLNPEISCGHHRATGEAVYSRAANISDLNNLMCFSKGMVNSSQNALVQVEDGWAPIGRLNAKFDLRHGVRVHKIINDFSRDGDIECVESKDDAEKLCLLAQRFPCCQFTLLDIALDNRLDVDRISARSLRSLKNAVDSKFEKHCLAIDMFRIDERSKLLILAGQ